MYVIKANGNREKYNSKKVRGSLLRAGANEATIQAVLQATKSYLKEGMSTKELYKFILKEYRKYEPLTASRYSIKESIQRLGEKQGYSFELFIAELLEKKGYQTKCNQIVKGKHITHEIDVIAQKKKERIMVECKHHEKSWIDSDVQTALYTYARFLDVQQYFTQPMIITNTRFTKQAIQYAQGVHMLLMGWKHPEGNSLEENCNKYDHFPITILQSLDDETMRECLKKQIVSIEGLTQFSEKQLVRKLSIDTVKAQKILTEINAILHKETQESRTG